MCAQSSLPRIFSILNELFLSAYRTEQILNQLECTRGACDKHSYFDQIFSEKPASNPSGIRCVNFITAAGGLLQAAIFGYAGIRYRYHHLDIRPRLLPNSTDWAVRGLHYQGFKVDVEIFQNMFKLTLVKDRRDKEICLSNKNEACEILKLRKSVTKPQQRFKIFIRDPRVGTATLALRIQPSVLLQLSLLLPLVSVFTL